MIVGKIHPCPLCGGPAACRLRSGQNGYTKNSCKRCGSFVVEPTLPPYPWARLVPEDALLAAFLPAYIRHCNRRNHTPLITLENWRTLARRGRIVALHSLQLAPSTLAR